MEADRDPEKHAPKQPRETKLPSAQSGAAAEQGNASQGDGEPMPHREPLVEAVALQVGCVTGERGGFAMKRATQDPAHMRPPFAFAGRVRIARLVGVLVG